MIMTAHELFGFMPPALANEILEFAYHSDKALYRTAMISVAEAKKLRPAFLEKKPRAERHVDMVSMLSRPRMEVAAGTLLRGWLVKSQAGLLSDFLDGLEIPHKDGVVEDLPETVADDKLKESINQLIEKHPREKVIVYLHSFCAMNEAPWGNLQETVRTDPRLQFS
jgi:hypothetical protein